MKKQEASLPFGMTMTVASSRGNAVTATRISRSDLAWMAMRTEPRVRALVASPSPQRYRCLSRVMGFVMRTTFCDRG
jgi:hypothetical protein